QHAAGLAIDCHSHDTAKLAILLDGGATERLGADLVEHRRFEVVARPRVCAHENQYHAEGARSIVVQLQDIPRAALPRPLDAAPPVRPGARAAPRPPADRGVPRPAERAGAPDPRRTSRRRRRARRGTAAANAGLARPGARALVRPDRGPAAARRARPLRRRAP